MDIGGIEIIETGSRLLTAEDVAEVTTHIERLEAENAKLRSMRDTWQENDAKLRELVRDLYDYAEFSIDYFGDIYKIHDRMNALGIEVEG